MQPRTSNGLSFEHSLNVGRWMLDVGCSLGPWAGSERAAGRPSSAQAAMAPCGICPCQASGPSTTRSGSSRCSVKPAKPSSKSGSAGFADPSLPAFASASRPWTCCRTRPSKIAGPSGTEKAAAMASRRPGTIGRSSPPVWSIPASPGSSAALTLVGLGSVMMEKDAGWAGQRRRR